MKTVVLCCGHCILLLNLFKMLFHHLFNNYMQQIFKKKCYDETRSVEPGPLQKPCSLFSQEMPPTFKQIHNSKTPKLNLNISGKPVISLKLSEINSNFTEFKTTNCLGAAFTHLKFCPIISRTFHTLNLYFCCSQQVPLNEKGWASPFASKMNAVCMP